MLKTGIATMPFRVTEILAVLLNSQFVEVKSENSKDSRYSHSTKTPTNRITNKI